MTPLLEVERLQVTVPTPGDPDMVAVDGVSFAVARGEFVALVGESGCGKSLTALAIPRLLPSGARLGPDTSIRFDGVELTPHPESAMRPLRGARIAMIFQDPLASLNPVMRVADQIVEAIRAHGTSGGARAEARAIELLSDRRPGAMRGGVAAPAERRDAAAGDDRDRAGGGAGPAGGG